MTAAALAGEGGPPPDLTVDQIVEKNVAARGGLEAWRGIQTMIWTGHINTGNPAAPIEPFVFELKRPNKMRFEINAEHERTVRLFDGATGWKFRASNSSPPALKPYSRSELRSARDAQGIDGLLIDHQAKGIKVDLDGTDQVEGRKAYRLNITLPSGTTRRLWVDAQTFLEVKYERQPHPPVGRTGAVFVHYRNYRMIGAVRMPLTIETEAQPGAPGERMTIDDVTLNPSLSDAHFERPSPAGGRDTPPELRSAPGTRDQKII